MILYEINDQVAALIADAIDPETGELLDEELGAKLQELELAEEDEIEALALYVKQLRYETVGLKTEEQMLAERRKRKENRIKSMTRYLAGYMQLKERKKFETPRVVLSFRTSHAAVIADIEGFVQFALANAPELLRRKPPEIELSAVKSALKDGAEIPGAALVERKNLQIK